jgi:CRISPR system Cascade subunit CasD
MRFLILRLEGPLMAFGDVAVDELRPTKDLPGLSMLTGLVANALGYRFTEGERLQRLQERIVYGARLERRGRLLRDFQTAQLAKSDMLWRTGGHGPAKRGGGEKTYDSPALRERYYRADSRVTVALSLAQDESPTLDDVAAALKRPFRPLFLGRVSCPPAAPIHRGEVVEADTAHQALELAARLPGTRDDPLPAMWPADGTGGSVPEALPPESLVTATDMRDWRNGVHAGSRRLVRSMVNPPRHEHDKEVRP